jgi:hypothetical protein
MSIYGQIATFVRAFGKQIKTHEALSLVADNVKKVPLQSVETCQTMYRISLSDVFNITSIMFQPGEFLSLQKSKGTGATSHVNARDQLVAAGRPLTHSSLSAPLHSRSIKQVSKDC